MSKLNMEVSPELVEAIDKMSPPEPGSEQAIAARFLSAMGEGYAAGFRAGQEHMRQRAVKLINENSEGYQLADNKRVLIPRADGDRNALGYAQAIAALPLEE